MLFNYSKVEYCPGNGFELVGNNGDIEDQMSIFRGTLESFNLLSMSKRSRN